MLIEAGCSLATCLRLGASTSGSDKLILESEVIAQQLEEGNGIMEAGYYCRMIPKLFLYSIQLGSQRNELQDNLYSLSRMYSEQTRCMQGRLQAVMLPLMLVLVGGFIGIMVLAMFLPMVSIVTTLM